MQISLQTIDDLQIASLTGDIDASTAPIVTEQILPIIKPSAKIILDMTKVAYMSSAGLRMLLSLHRQSTGQNSILVIVGLSEDVQDTMAVTGFLSFFKTYSSLEEATTIFQT
ncbi:STAS domain-containing protein [Picosynechococcus sp. NKBG15041c]|uniref:STAS domain-containing protein n=1 Tax=Picosynechococcus sp. NKBG15041c TaxID=1407650 RepID=UPI00041D3B6A|nr:STAS domain-containing protein [Picosynechococcus sp. NKBG15041c]